MYHMSKFVLAGCVLCAAVLVQGCAVSSTNSVVKPGDNKGGFMGLSKNPEVMVDNAGTLKELPNKVIIGSFKVGFITEGKARAVAKGGFLSSGSAGRASATAYLRGLTQEDMRNITNQMYTAFVSTLQDKGYEVVPHADLAANAQYTDLQNSGVASLDENVVLNAALDSKTTYVAPDGMKVIYFMGEKKAFMDISMETIKKMQALNETSGAAVLAVNYVVNFVGAETHGGWVSTASVQVGQGIRIGVGNVAVYNGKNKMAALVKLGQPVYSEKEFCTIEKTTSAAAKTIGTAVNVATAILGGGTSQSETFDFNVKPDLYMAAATEVGNQANAKLIGKLAEIK